MIWANNGRRYEMREDDYISRKALIEHIKAHCGGCDNCGEVMHCAWDTPAADVIPAQWNAVNEVWESVQTGAQFHEDEMELVQAWMELPEPYREDDA